MRIVNRMTWFAASLCLLGGRAEAGTVGLGALSYDTFIPAGNGSPGTFAFDLYNLTGPDSLPTDFPVADSLTFVSAKLTLTLSNLSQEVIDLGDIGPGYLSDANGNPIVQVPGDEVFDSAEFTATLSPVTSMLADGTAFTADSSSINVTLLPSIGSNLTVDLDSVVVSATESIAVSTPEPASRGLVLAGFLAMWLFVTFWGKL